jgi:uncharacterized protein (DUF427 family)
MGVMSPRHAGRRTAETGRNGKGQGMTTIRIRQAEGTWTVRAGGAILVESRNALALAEGTLDDVIYFPRADVAMALLDESDHRTHCPHKGDATYFSIVTNSQTLENAAWSYESPKEELSRIKDHIAFHTGDEVTVERV